MTTDISQQRTLAYDRLKSYMNDRFHGLDIPEYCIRKAFDACFDSATSQDILNDMVKTYLINNLATM